MRGRRSARQRDTSEAASVELGGARTNDVIWLLKAKGQAVEAQVLLRQLDVLLLHVRHTRQAGSVGCGYNCCISMSPAPVPPIAARQLDLRTAAAASQQPPPRRMPPTTTRPNRTTAELPSTSTRRQPQHSSTAAAPHSHSTPLCSMCNHRNKVCATTISTNQFFRLYTIRVDFGATTRGPVGWLCTRFRCP